MVRKADDSLLARCVGGKRTRGRSSLFRDEEHCFGGLGLLGCGDATTTAKMPSGNWLSCDPLSGCAIDLV